jgi:intracellular sulfur oxidation DsrE/DsrF family protein
MKNKVILLTTDIMGTEREIGEQALETFFTLLKQKDEKPKAIFCVNKGVLALTDASLCSVHLKELEDSGVEVLACKTCVDYYEVESKLTVGVISGMGTFVNLASEYEVLTIS